MIRAIPILEEVIWLMRLNELESRVTFLIRFAAAGIGLPNGTVGNNSYRR
jgi:hypothetical protein